MKTNRVLRAVLRYAFVISVLIPFDGTTQNQPVQANVITTGPYLNYLSYYGDENNHLQIILTNTDFWTSPIIVRLRLRIEGAGWVLYTDPNATIGQPFVLESGMPVYVSGIELLPYLLEGNLVNPNGIDINNIPEGFATVCVEVVNESAQQQVLSTNNCGFLPIEQVRPPTPFLPACGSRLDTTTMFENFQWFAPNPPAIGLGVDTKYDLSVFWWQDTTNFSDNAWQYNPVYFEPLIESGEIFTVPIYEMNLIPGQKYVWNVKARVFVDNVEKKNATVNNGISQNCVFYYGESMTLAEQLTEGLEIELFTSPSSERKGKAWWTVTDNTPNQGLSNFDEFYIEYRRQPTGNEGYEIPWHYKTIPSYEYFIYQLEPSTTYEVKVSGVVAGVVGDPTPVKTFTTPEPRVYNCGEADMPFLPTNYTVLENATVGTQVQIGQFTMTMTEVNELGGGHYAGKGTIPIAFLGGAKAKVRFDDILIDTEYLVHEGRVDVITKGLDNWLDEQYQQFIDPYYVNGVVDSAWVDTVAGVAWVTIDGVDTSFTFNPPHYPIIVNDENGNQYTIYPNGTIVVSSYLAISENWAVMPDDVIHFAQNDDESRGFDGKEHMQWHENYEIMMLADSSKYFVANKSLAKDAADYVNVEIPSGASASFQFSDGTPINASPLQGTWLGESLHTGSTKMTLNIPARSSAGNYSIYALVNNQKVGQLNIKVYSKKERELVVVPIASSTLTKAQIEEELDGTLGEANIDVDVTIEPQWTDTSGVFTASTNISLPNEVGMLSKYSQDMRDLRDAYFEQHPNAAKNKYYLFLVNGFDNPNELGYMVRGRSMGFIKASQQNVLQTISHELGHGMGALEHSWNDNGPEEGTTNNLMDYSVGNNLTKSQWKELRDFDITPSLFDNVDDFLYGFDNAIPFYQDQQVWEPITSAQSKMGFVFLNGQRYKFRPEDNVTEVMFDKFGRVYGFKTATDTYKAFITRGNVTQNYNCHFYVSETDHSNYQSAVYVPGAVLDTSEWNYLQQNKYQFADCPINEQCFRMSVIYRHSGLSSSPNLWVSDDCYVEDIFVNSAHTPVSGYTGGIYLGPSFTSNNFSVIDGDANDCWFPPSVTNLDETGAGAIIYYELSQNIGQDAAAISNLVDLANHFSEMSANDVRIFYDYQTNAYTYFGVSNASAGSPLYYNEPTLIPEVFERDSIYSIQDFYNAFPRTEWFFDRKHDSIISTHNIRSTIPEWYNAQSIDYTTYDIPSFKDWTVFDYEELGEVVDYIEDLYDDVVAADPSYASNQNMQNTVAWIAEARSNLPLTLTYKLELRHNIIAILNTLGAFDKYEYSILDLVARQSLVQSGGGVFLAAIQSKEQDGMAGPINGLESNTQYMNRFNTDCAFYLGFEYMKMYVDNFFEPVALLNVIQKAQAVRSLFKSHKASYQKNLDDIFKGMNNSSGDIIQVLKNHPQFSKLGLTPAQLDEFKVLLDSKMPNNANDVLNGLKTHLDAGTSFEEMPQMISGLKNNWGNFSDGSKWVFNYIGSSEGLLNFSGKKIRFELPTETELGLRRIDVADITDPNAHILYEFKSVQNPFNSTYAKQFIKDINVVDDLSQVRWLYDGGKVSSLNKSSYVNLLTSNSGLNSTKVRSVFSNFAEDLGLPPITNQTQLEAFLNSNNDWFTEVFRIAQ